MDEVDMLAAIHRDFPDFKKEKFIEGAKIDIRNLYQAFCNDEWGREKVNCTEKLKSKIVANLSDYRISKNYDTMTIQYINLNGYTGGEEKILKVYASIVFYDNVKNNEENVTEQNDKYFNDAWIISYKNYGDQVNLKCNNCGATMKKDEINNLLECEYCRNKRYFNFQTDFWEIEDIEVKK